MSWVMVDIEANGPLIGTDRMTEFGAVIVREPLVTAFHGIMDDTRFVSPVSNILPDTIKGTPGTVMQRFRSWLGAHCVNEASFIADNPGFDFAWMNWYSWTYLDEGIFGHTSQNLGSIYKGMEKHMGKNFKHLRQTRHTHNPVDDAMGNAESLLYLKNNKGLKIKLF